MDSPRALPAWRSGPSIRHTRPRAPAAAGHPALRPPAPRSRRRSPETRADGTASPAGYCPHADFALRDDPPRLRTGRAPCSAGASAGAWPAACWTRRTRPDDASEAKLVPEAPGWRPVAQRCAIDTSEPACLPTSAPVGAYHARRDSLCHTAYPWYSGTILCQPVETPRGWPKSKG